MTTLPDTPKLSKLFRLQWEEAQNDYVLLYPEGMVKLSRSAAEILKLCDGINNIDEITQLLERTFSVSGLQADVTDFLRIANERSWIN